MQNKIKKLETEIIKHRFLYYTGQPEISDAEYDELEKELKTIDPNNKLFSEVGFNIEQSSFKKINHIKPMLSLDKIYSFEEYKKWVQDMKNLIMVLTPKIDGFAISIKYKWSDKSNKYLLVLGSSRGDGLKGEDITENIKQIKDIPFSLPIPKYKNKEEIEIRGEIYMKKSVFSKLISEKKIDSESNIRNIAAGSARHKDPKITKERNLSFYAYGSPSLEFDNYSDTMDYIQTVLNIPVTPFIKLDTQDKINNIYEKMAEKRESLDFLIDGVVLRIDDNKIFESLGSTSHHPRGSIAWKFESVAVKSILKSVVWQNSRTGTINPVAIINPVEIDGVTVTRATLHNLSYIRELKLKIGNEVEIVRRGDVIPKITKNLSEEHGNFSDIIIPKTCPSCGGQTMILKSDSGTEILICNNDNCKDKIISKLSYFAEILEMKGISDAIIEKIYDKGLLKTFSDFYKLKNYKNELLSIDGFKNKSVDNILNTIENSKNKPLGVILNGLGIKHLGKNISTLIEQNFDVNKLYSITEEDLLKINGIGLEIAKEFVKGIKNYKNEIDELLKHICIINTTPVAGGKLSGKSFCITGTLSKGRAEVQKIIRDNGGIVYDNVNKTLTYLIVGDSPGSKIDKAKKYGVKIIKESDLAYMLGDDYKSNDKIQEKNKKKEKINKNTNIIDSI